MIEVPNSALDTAQAWLDTVKSAIESADASKLTDCFQPTGWLRDILVFGWDRRSREGREAIQAYLEEEDRFKFAGITNIVLDEDYYTQPKFFPAHGFQGLDVTFKFDTKLFRGVGSAILLPSQNEDGWKAVSVSFLARDVIGHEEPGNPTGDFMRERHTYEDDRKAKRAEVEADPHVLIVGGGQCGLITAARFRQMGISSIVIERNANVGDNWMQRYPTLTLHTPRTHHELLYSTYPRNWPTYTPRDKLAGWLKQYVEAQELVVWTSSTVVPTPKFDKASSRWNVTVRRGNEEISLRPAHIVIATGYLGAPRTPALPGIDKFQGKILHSEGFHGGAQFKGKNVVVIGSGDSAADICQDLHHGGAASVIMVQRGPTNVVSAEIAAQKFGPVFPEGRPTDVSDLKAQGLPMGLLKKWNIADQDNVEEYDKEMIDGLKKAGFQFSAGPERQGGLILIYERHGGTWINLGCAELIAEGKVKVRQYSALEGITEEAVEWTNGEKLPTDAIIMGTGYQTVRDIHVKDFGPENIDKTGPVWGLDEEGELRGNWKPSGHPALWYAVGSFDLARFQSKTLGIYIKALQLGLVDSETLQKSTKHN